MINVIKDIISIFVYFFITPFYRTKNAILVYHSVDDIAPDKDPYKMNVRPDLFQKHMNYLTKHKARCSVMFDDGFESVYTNAFPILKKMGLTAVLFLTTDFIDRKIKFSYFFGNRYDPTPLTWDEINKMALYGIKIGSHSVTHRKMSDLSEDEVYRELDLSRKKIKEMIGIDITSFSYPFGNRRSFGKKTQALLNKVGYTSAYVNVMGMDNSEERPYAIKRIRIYGTDNMFRFGMKIAGAYNWVDALASLSLFKKG